MRNVEKYQGIIPAFYACYDNEGNISVEGIQKLTQHLLDKGVKGVYVGGSSGECIYQSVAERKLVLENVMKIAKGKMTVIAHIACNNTRDSQELAAHAESLGVDAIGVIPPITLNYLNTESQNTGMICQQTPNTDFIIYNIPQLAGVSLTMSIIKRNDEKPKSYWS